MEINIPYPFIDSFTTPIDDFVWCSKNQFMDVFKFFLDCFGSF